MEALDERMHHALQHYLQRTGFEAFTPKAALYDMDGVLYDSMPHHAVAWHESMAEYGIEISEYDAFRYEGMRGVETIKELTRQQWGREVSDDEAAAMYSRKSYHFSLFPSAAIIPGVKALQESMKKSGMTIGIVTGSGQHSLIDRILHDFNGLVSDQCIVTAHDVSQGKPAPIPYLAGMRKTGTAPCETIVVENAPLGVMSAVAAKCFTIAVNTGPLDSDILYDAGADIVLSDMYEAREFFLFMMNSEPTPSLHI